MFENPSREALKQILSSAKTIAVVGLSDNPARESYAVTQEMQRRGYRIVPVNPMVSAVLGESAYAQLGDIPFPVDVVNVFRRSEALLDVVMDARQINAPVIWAQQGVYSEEAAEAAKAAGKTMVMDSCIMVMHSLLMRTH